jgi:uncharacterized protein YwbE
VVGRELLTIYPDGEDHQGHDLGDKTGDGRHSGEKGIQVDLWRLKVEEKVEEMTKTTVTEISLDGPSHRADIRLMQT